MKTLYLPIKKKWFDMIKSGDKTQEYREIKDFWMRRLISLKDDMEYSAWDEFITDLNHPYNRHSGPDECLNYFEARFKEFDSVEFRNGYDKKVPSLKKELRYIAVGTGNKRWGAVSGKFYFILELGKIMVS